MKHFTKHWHARRGQEVFSLIDDHGDVVQPFQHFVAVLVKREFARATVKRYMEVVANFLDYLVEAGVFGMAVPAVTLNQAVECYLWIRARSDRILAVPDNEADEDIAWAKPIIRSLSLRPVSPSDNQTAAINLFLRLSETLAQTEWEQVRQQNIQPNQSAGYQAAIRAIDGFSTMTQAQRSALKQCSMLANVMRMNPTGIRRQRGLKASGSSKRPIDGPLAFPLDRLSDLFKQATSVRDKALWVLLAASGLRSSEAMNLRWPDIDVARQKVFVEDPDNLRFSQDLPLEERARFKGRTVSDTYLYQPLRNVFFDLLLRYLRTEYIAGAGHDLVFQDIRAGVGLGRPMRDLSDTARIKAFKAAIARASIPSGRPGEQWVLHSLRHSFGVYMLNYLPVPGGYGLTLKEVQRLMGHKLESSTAHYAREDRLILSAKLEHADILIGFGVGDSVSLPKLIAGRLRQEAERHDPGGMP